MHICITIIFLIFGSQIFLDPLVLVRYKLSLGFQIDYVHRGNKHKEEILSFYFHGFSYKNKMRKKHFYFHDFFQLSRIENMNVFTTIVTSRHITFRDLISMTNITKTLHIFIRIITYTNIIIGCSLITQKEIQVNMFDKLIKYVMQVIEFVF